MKTYLGLILALLAVASFANNAVDGKSVESEREGRQQIFGPIVPAGTGVAAPAPVPGTPAVPGVQGTGLAALGGAGGFTNLLLAKLRSKGLLPAAAAANNLPASSIITTTQLVNPTAPGGTGATGPISISSQFTTGANVAVPVGATAIGGPGPGLSSDDPDFGNDGALIRNKMRENCAFAEENDDGEDYDDEDEIDDEDDEEETGVQYVKPMAAARDERTERQRKNQERIARENEALIRQFRRTNRLRQIQQRRANLRRRRRAAAMRRNQQARRRAQIRNRQNRLSQLRQQTRNRNRRRNFLRG